MLHYRQNLCHASNSASFQTKGLSLEQIDLMYQNTVPVKAHAYRRQLMAGEVGAPAEKHSDNHSDEKV